MMITGLSKRLCFSDPSRVPLSLEAAGCGNYAGEDLEKVNEEAIGSSTIGIRRLKSFICCSFMARRIKQI